MKFNLDIDSICINYSYVVTYCHFSIKGVHVKIKIGSISNLG